MLARQKLTQINPSKKRKPKEGNVGKFVAYVVLDPQKLISGIL